METAVTLIVVGVRPKLNQKSYGVFGSIPKTPL